MANFSTNQVRQLYVSTTNNPVEVGSTISGDVFFKHAGVSGPVRSDLIQKENILYAKATNASDMVRPLKSFTVALDSNVNSGAPVSGQDYILRINFRQFVGMSDEDQYFKHGMVHAYSTMSASKFYETLAISLYRNFSREASKLVEFALTDGTNTTVVANVRRINDVDTPFSAAGTAITGTFTGVVINELVQDWRLGVMTSEPVYFNVSQNYITLNGDEIKWAVITDNTPKKDSTGVWTPTLTATNSVHNGKTIADLEYFCMGERGDIYRKIGWPNNFDTKYLVDPSNPYHTFDIHYAFVGSGENPQKSEKTITIVCADDDELNDIIDAFETASGLTIAGV